MAAMNNFLRLGFIPRNYDLALLLLRAWFGLTLLCLHGWVKVAHFSQMAGHFPNPLHLGSTPSLLFAILSDVISAILVTIGLATRWAALVIAVNTGVAFSLVHRFAFHGPHSGELPWLFLGWAITILIAGPGRYSVDQG